jgi:hypothetical protein
MLLCLAVTVTADGSHCDCGNPLTFTVVKAPSLATSEYCPGRGQATTFFCGCVSANANESSLNHLSWVMAYRVSQKYCTFGLNLATWFIRRCCRQGCQERQERQGQERQERHIYGERIFQQILFSFTSPSEIEFKTLHWLLTSRLLIW